MRIIYFTFIFEYVSAFYLAKESPYKTEEERLFNLRTYISYTRILRSFETDKEKPYDFIADIKDKLPEQLKMIHVFG